MRNRRLTSTAILLVLAIPVGLTGVAYACAPSNWGWTQPGAPSATPVAPDASGAQPPATTSAPDPSTEPASRVTQVSEQPTAQVPVKQAAASPAAKPATSTATETKRSPATHTSTPAPPAGVAPRPVVAPAAAVQPPVQRAVTAATPGKTHAAPRATHAAKAHATPAATSTKAVAKTPAAAKPAPDRWSASAGPVAGLSSDTGTSPGVGADGRMLFGVVLLGFGLVALFGGFAVVESRRRRVHSSSRAATDNARP
jgi:hypothetical protein